MKIWFNHWFSTAYHLIEMIKKGEPGKYTVIGSNEKSTSVYQCACDEWYAEPAGVSDDEYVSFCLDFCREHSVDIFAPRKGLLAISRAHEKFEELGVRLLVDPNHEIISMLEDKIATYDFLKNVVPEYIPEYRKISSLDEFLEAYEDLSERHPRICYKLIEDEGARSFRVIDDEIESIRGVLEKPGSKITLEAAKKVLSLYDFSIPILMMPYLGGCEVSVDCIKTASGNLILPRYKTSKRYSEIKFSEEMMQTCSKIMDFLALDHPMNIQFKKSGDQYYLLEINPRMSGGLQLSCLAAEINMPDIAVSALCGINKPWKYPEFSSRKVVHLETPVCLD